MTSRISYSKLSKENRKRNLGVMLITVLAFFIKAVIFVMSMKTCETYDDFISIMRPNMMMAGVVIGLAVVSAGGSLYYLHSRSQTDFYESLPIKRTMLFRISALNSLIVFLIPLIIEEAVEFVVAGQQILGGSIFAVVSSVLWYLLVFAATWLTMALAMIMTGNIIVGVLGFGVFATYFPIVLYNIFPMYANSFFKTYSGKTAESVYNSITNCLSPVWIGLRGMAYINTGIRTEMKYMALLLLWIIGLYVLCQGLYNKRLAESAGRAMAFPKANTVIKMLLVVPAALYSGIIFYTFGSENGICWLIFGVVFGVIVVHALIECIYQFDVRAVFTHKKQMVFAMICSLFIMVSFSADIFGYDRYVPKASALDDIVIQPTDRMYSYGYWGKGQTGLKKDAMKLSLSMIKESVEVKNNTNESDASDAGESSTIYERTGNLFFMSSASKQEVYSNDIDISVTFNRKNGQKVNRNYTLRSKKAKQLYSQLYATREFKQDMYSLYTGNYNKIQEICWYGIDSRYLNLTEAEKKQFLDTYLNELAGLSYDEVRSTVPIGRFDLSAKGESENTTEVFDAYYIYPSFTKTIAFLKAKGCEADKTVADLDITSLDITTDEEGNGNTQYTISDKKIIDQVKGKLVLLEMLNAPGTLSPNGNFIDIQVNYKDNGGLHSVSCQTDSETEKMLSKF